jgi:very-short-patch-repair endonuclease
MPAKKIVIQQYVALEMLERVIELRRNMTPAERKLWQHLRAGRQGLTNPRLHEKRKLVMIKPQITPLQYIPGGHHAGR